MTPASTSTSSWPARLDFEVAVVALDARRGLAVFGDREVALEHVATRAQRLSATAQHDVVALKRVTNGDGLDVGDVGRRRDRISKVALSLRMGSLM